MKLLTKINIQYFLFSSVAFLIFGLAIFYAYAAVIAEEQDEKLLTTRGWIQKLIIQGKPIPSFEPFILIEETETQQESNSFSDITLKIGRKQENEEFRQLVSVRNINEMTYQITVREEKFETSDLLEGIAGLSVFLFMMLAVSLLILNYLINRQVWKPFFRNLNRVSHFSLQSSEPLQLQDSGISEFDRLNRVIYDLTNKIISDYQNLKQFSEDASHELQTPLAIVTSKLESLLNTEELSPDAAASVRAIYSAIDRLTRLSKNLVLLTRVENNQFEDLAELDLGTLISDKLHEFNELLELKSISVSADLKDSFPVKMSRLLAGILITNLISNAIKHNTINGHIDLKLRKHELEIRNSGNKHAEDPNRIFERFYKSDSSSRSAGLGLAIVRKICDLNNLKITYQYQDEEHIFRVGFVL